MTGSAPPVVAVLRLSGAIGMSTGLRKGLAMATSASSIAKLFADKTVVAAARRDQLARRLAGASRA